MKTIFHCRNLSHLHNSQYVWNLFNRNRIGRYQRSNYSTTDNDAEKSEDSVPKVETEFPEEPTTCCMSGCANCVWLEYTEKLSAYMRDNGEAAVQIIEQRVSDDNIKAFLLHELRMRQKVN